MINPPYVYFGMDSNSLSQSTQFCFLLSSNTGLPRGLYMYENNIRRSISFYVVRRLTSLHTYIDHDDVYMGRREKKNDMLV
jgi:hypothetical protein